MSLSYTATFGAAVDLAFATSTHTFTGLTLGVGDILVFVYNPTASRVTTAVVVDTVSATPIANNGDPGGANDFTVWIASGVSVASGNVQITSNIPPGQLAICGGLVISEAGSPTATWNVPASNPDPQSFSLTVPTGSIGVVTIADNNNSGNPTTWTGVTRDSVTESTITTGNIISMASAHSAVGAGSITATMTGGGGGNGWGFSGAAIGALILSPASSGGGGGGGGGGWRGEGWTSTLAGWSGGGW